MKRRLLSLLLALVMALGLLSITAWADGHNHCICGADGTGHSHGTNIEWTKWEATDSLPADAGSYYLDKDVTLSGTWTVSTEIKLCLNGHTIMCRSTSGNGITISTGASLTLTDCGTTGTIRGNTTEKDGSAVYMNGVFFNMYGGTISGNVTKGFGGGVNVNSGTFNMYGGIIKENKANKSGMGGGGVYVNTGAAFNMSGGTISNNEGAYGGGVYNKGAFSMNGGTISSNKATKAAAGGVYLFDDGGSFVMTGGSITDNTAKSMGGGVNYSKGSLMLGGTAKITGNLGSVMSTSQGSAQNVYLSRGKTITCGIDANAFRSGASIGVRTANRPTEDTPITIAAGASAGDAAYFTSDANSDSGSDSDYEVAFVNGGLQLRIKSASGEGDAQTPPNDTPDSPPADEPADDPAEEPAAPGGHTPIRRQNTTAAETADTNMTDTTVADTTTADAVTSAKTFDAGIAAYGVMAVASLLGMGCVKKKR